MRAVRKFTTALGMVMAAGLLSAVALMAQQKTTLTAEDHLAIQHLVSTYPYGLDTGRDDGRLWANLFTEDGAFVAPTGTIQGRAKLAEFASGHRPGQGPLLVRNFSTNLWIEPTAEGATGKVYAVVIAFGENGAPSSIITGGHFEDVYVKTAAGWRIKRREFVPSKVRAAQ